MFRKIGDWFRNFMLGRYGADQLNNYLLLGGIVVMLLGSFLRHHPLLSSLCSLVSYAALFWCIFRMYSKNIEARRQENQAVLNCLNRLRDRQHRYFRCPRCRQMVRVPRGRGKINIRCPKCGTQFVKKT